MRTEAWVLYRGEDTPRNKEIAPSPELRCEMFDFPAPDDDEVLVEPIVGCWEGNMNHALLRRPVDICLQRNEPKVVIGNAGVVRVLRPGRDVRSVREGDVCLVFCNGIWDEHGYPQKIYGYDAPNTVGLLARRTKLHERQLIRLPAGSRSTFEQWAAFSLRFITAWANWKVAYGSWRLQMPAGARPSVWGWGGGVTLAELMLAQRDGCATAMLSSHNERLTAIQNAGIEAVDRRTFPDLNFDAELYRSSDGYRERYLASEHDFLETVKSLTGGRGVSIFVDYIGKPVFRATLKSLARPAVITTAGWKGGMDLSIVRAMECIQWHVHVHTHYARYEEGVEAVQMSEETGWAPPPPERRWRWDRIPELALQYSRGEISDLFPIFEINVD